jgi:hypothetical protein
MNKEQLQTEYNELHERMGNSKNPATIAAINKQLDRISAEMTAILDEKNRANEKN